jgi:hypothetical protein
MIVLVATFGIAWYPKDQGDSGDLPVVDVTTLESYSVSDTGERYLEVGNGTFFAWWSSIHFDYLRELPGRGGHFSFFFTNHIIVRVHWMDEPDQSGLIWGYENQPDTVRFTIVEEEGLFEFSQEVTNVHGEEGEIVFDWQGHDTYLADAYFYYEGGSIGGDPSGWEYINVTNGRVIWDYDIDERIRLVEAGDQVHELLPLQQTDEGNLVSWDITISGCYFIL